MIVLRDLKETKGVLKKNFSASLIDLGDDVLCLEFHSKMNALDPDIFAMGDTALEELEKGYAGLVIGNQGENFSVGANVFNVVMAAEAKQLDQIEQGVKSMQDLLMDFRYCGKPVVAAPFGMALGGGAEVAMAADRICAAGETYMGQVEVGVGLLPAGGGCRELLKRVVSPAMKRADSDPLPFLGKVFENIAMAKVSASALQAQEMGFLTESRPDHHERGARAGRSQAGSPGPGRRRLCPAAADQIHLCPGTAGYRRPVHYGPIHALGGFRLRLRYVYRQEDRLRAFRRRFKRSPVGGRTIHPGSGAGGLPFPAGTGKNHRADQASADDRQTFTELIRRNFMKDIVIVSAARTAVGRAKRGMLVNVRPDDLAAIVLNEVIQRAPGIKKEDVEDVVIGCAFPENTQGLNMGRLALLKAGFPYTTSGQTVNRFCSSGLQAIAIGAQQIMAGMCEMVAAGGAESMSQVPMTGFYFAPNPDLVEEYPEPYMGMGLDGRKRG